MSRSEQLAIIRDQARILADRTAEHEQSLAALVAAAEMDVRRAEAALSDAVAATHAPIDRLQSLLSDHLQRSQDSAETARQLSAGAHAQRVAAGQLLTHLDRDLSPEPCAEQRACRDAVLVVDDYGDVREVIAQVLRNAGFVVRTAANGLEGLLARVRDAPRGHPDGCHHASARWHRGDAAHQGG